MLKEARQALKPVFHGLEAYFVGGCVRDALINVTPKDIDVVVRCHPDELLARGAKHISPTSAFPVYLIQVNPIGTIQAALPRTETKTGNGYHGFTTDSGTHVPIEEDLRRRDFTINAMAMDISTGRIIDPFGGRTDLQARVLRHTSTAFIDDPLRVFRLYRFAGKGYSPHPATRTFIQTHDWSSDFKALPTERVYTELMKAMDEDRPERFFIELIHTGVGGTFFPEVFAMPRIPAGPPMRHPEGDLFTHSLQTLTRAAATTQDPLTRLCAFLHDIGKTATPPEDWPSHHGHDQAGHDCANRILRRLKAPSKVTTAVSAVNALHMKGRTWHKMRQSSRINLCLQAAKGGISRILPIVVKADSNIELLHWEEVTRVAHLSATKTGIPLKWIRSHQQTPDIIAAHLMHQKVELLKDLPFS